MGFETELQSRESSTQPSLSPSLFITGLGLATPLGNTCPATWTALRVGGAVLDHARVPGFGPADGEPRVNALACRVAREAIAHAHWGEDDLHSAALLVGTSKGPVDAWIAGADAAQTGTAGGQSLCFGLADTAVSVASALNIGGPKLTLSAACASGLHALIRAAMMILAGEASRALVVASESSLHPLFIESFRRLGVLPPPGHGCRPFDRTRAGFVVSEAAAAVCLEGGERSPWVGQAFLPAIESVSGGTFLSLPNRFESGQTRMSAPPGHAVAIDYAFPEIRARSSQAAGRPRPIAVLDRFALGADATHLTAGDPQARALRHVLHRVVDGRPLDLIHAHGTGTVANDPVELAALEASLTDRANPHPPSLYSHKGALGHSLGAAGLVAVVINCLSHSDQLVPPNVHTHTPLDSATIAIRPGLHSRPIHRSLVLAAGFGGAVGAVTVVNNDE